MTCRCLSYRTRTLEAEQVGGGHDELGFVSGVA